MFPLNAIPTPGNTKFQVFYTSNPSVFGSTFFQTWQKPAGCSMVYIFAMAGGGGGGRPPDGATTVGGGGGGSSGAIRVLIPAALLPDTLYILPGAGGAGATTANTAGSAGLSTWVQVAPVIAGSSSIIRVYPGGGGAASTTAGVAGQGTPANENPYGSLGLWYSIAGQAGGPGANIANFAGSPSVFGSSGIITTGGSGGSNGNVAGVGFAAQGLFPVINNGSPANSGLKAANGFQKGAVIQPGLKSFPLFFSGGASGGGGTTTAAGSGGDASYGGGGGGGGGCSTSGTSGNGGNGGDGFVIIGTF